MMEDGLLVCVTCHANKQAQWGRLMDDILLLFKPSKFLLSAFPPGGGGGVKMGGGMQGKRTLAASRAMLRRLDQSNC